MSQKFKIGDRVRIIKSISSKRIGVITTIMSDLAPLGVVPEGCPYSGFPPDMLVHYLDLLPLDHPNPGRVVYPPECLELVEELGSDKAEWTEELKSLCNYDKNIVPVKKRENT